MYIFIPSLLGLSTHKTLNPKPYKPETHGKKLPSYDHLIGS